MELKGTHTARQRADGPIAFVIATLVEHLAHVLGDRVRVLPRQRRADHLFTVGVRALHGERTFVQCADERAEEEGGAVSGD